MYKVNLTNINFLVCLFLYFIFTLAFTFGPGLKYMLPSLSNVEFFTLAKFVIFIFGCILVLVNLILKKNSIHLKDFIFYFILLLIIFVSIFVGITNNEINKDFFSQLSTYINFAVFYFLGRRIGFIDDTFFNKYIKFYSIIILIISFIIITIVYLNNSSDIRISIGLYILIIPLAYFISRFNLYLMLGWIFAFLTFKRSFLIAIFFQVFFLKKTKILISKLLSNSKIIFIFSFFTIFLLIILNFEQFEIYEIYEIFHRRYMQVDNRSLNIIDSFTSGRVTDVFAVLYTLSINDSLISGLGFGSVYNSYTINDMYSNEWIKSGSDIMFAHFWLIHGLVIGSFIFIYLIYKLFDFSKFSLLQNRQYTFFYSLYVLSIFIFLFSFVPSDPVIGLCLGTLNNLKFKRKLNV